MKILKNNIQRIKTALLLGALAVALFLFIIQNAQAINLLISGFRSVKSTAIEIDVHSNCKNITNNSNIDYFIPTKQSFEWLDFLAHKPVSVTSGACAPAVVDGGWTDWSGPAFGACTATCGVAGIQSRTLTRSCTNPSPEGNGADCSALDADGAKTSKVESISCPALTGCSATTGSNLSTSGPHISNNTMCLGTNLQNGVTVCNGVQPYGYGEYPSCGSKSGVMGIAVTTGSSVSSSCFGGWSSALNAYIPTSCTVSIGYCKYDY